MKQRANARSAEDLPRFPICASGREGCSMLGFHGHHSPQTDAERDRIQRWRAMFDAGLSSRPGRGGPR